MLSPLSRLSSPSRSRAALSRTRMLGLRAVWAAAAVAAPLSVTAAEPAAENPFADFEVEQFATAVDATDAFRSAADAAADGVQPAPLDLTDADAFAMPAAAGEASTAASGVMTAGFEAGDETEQTIRQVGWNDLPAAQTPVQTVSQSTAGEPAIAAAVPHPSITAVAETLGGRGAARQGEAEQAAAVTLQWKSLGAVNVGQECRCELAVANTGTSAASGVSVEAHFPKTVRLVSVTPQPDAAQSFLGWDLGTLAPGATKTLSVSYVPSGGAQVEPHARVRYTSQASASFAVLEPKLAAELVAQAGTSRVGEPVPQTIRVTNPGTGVASNVQIEVTVPDGLSHPAGRRLVTDLGSLHPGETRSVRVLLSAVRGGEHTVAVKATADGRLIAGAESTVAVSSPKLVASIDGPKLRYLGRTATFRLAVTNDGASADDNVLLMHKVPAEYEFVEGSRGARFDPASGIVRWALGRVEAGQTAEASVTLRAKSDGESTHFVRASGEQGIKSDATYASRVEAVSLIGVEVEDMEDPVEVGREVGYEVHVTNEGSAAATQVALACELPVGAELVSADGPVAFRSESGQVTFAPLEALAPGQRLTFRVVLAGGRSGNGVFKAHVRSDSAEPITSEELTRFYAE